ncbi:type II toxin-antitoxin system VapC family toxin [Arhodomonas sp. AD133]|uniref:type II toxin-antitoxin system VapC family toxin n=1 Tax=Arhodomonas sp. AD133 TaxID=3415009 RepID=UPI003EC01108
MSPGYLLDTNIISALVRKPRGSVATRIAAVGEDSVCTSVVVTAELRFGAAKSGSERLVRQLETVLSAVKILPLEPPVDAHYAALRHDLERAGTPIGPNDMLIAAHARALGLTVVTANIREFERVPDLAVEDWLSDQGLAGRM